jgi:hypothetical protein
MDVLAFIASVIQSLAWPAAIVLIVFMFRQSLAKLIPGLQRLKYKDIQLEFGRQLEEVKQELGPSPAPPGLPGPVPEPPRLPEPKGTTRYYRSLAEVSPRAAILEAWLGFELAANAAVESLQPSNKGRPLSMPRLFSVLSEAELLTSAEVDALTRLRALRNQVVHGPEPDLSVDVIAEYTSLLRRITDDLQTRANRRFGGTASA